MDLEGRLSEWIAGHSRAFGIALALLSGVCGTVVLTLREPFGSEQPSDALAYVLLWGISLCLVFFRSNPLPALVVSALLTLVYWVRDYPDYYQVAFVFAFYAATRHGGEDRRSVWRVVGSILLVIMGIATLGVIVPEEDLPALALVGIFMLHAGFAAIGEARYQRSRHIAGLEHRAEVLEADLENKAALAAVEERTRIAREMHDVIAHGLSAVVVQSQAAQSVVESDPEKARDVLETIEQIGRNSSDEMRRMLGVLRDDDGVARQPQPTLNDLDALASQVAVAGLEFELTVSGTKRQLSPGLELTGYRLVQEALTNVLRHAGRPVGVNATVDYGDAAISIVIVDDGLGAAASPATQGAGHGLMGMRERVEIYSGTLNCGPNPGGGFRVEATLPIAAVSTALV